MKKVLLKTFAVAGCLSLLASVPAFAGWEKTDDGLWHYSDNGSYMTNAWKLDGGSWFYLNENGTLALSQFVSGDDGSLYYVNADGQMVENQWINIGGTYYYAGNGGAILKNTTTPDGYYVDANGVWDQSAVVQTPKKEEGLPTLSAHMLTKTNPKCSSVLVELTNKSDSDIIVYGQGSRYEVPDYESFKRNTHLTILSDDNSSVVTLTQLTLKPGDDKTVFFRIDGEKTWYDNTSEMTFCIEYKNKGYMCTADPKWGITIYSFDYLAEVSGTQFTLDQLKILPY